MRITRSNNRRTEAGTLQTRLASLPGTLAQVIGPKKPFLYRLLPDKPGPMFWRRSYLSGFSIMEHSAQTLSAFDQSGGTTNFHP
jgi:hypothetical protein